jgi:hypothetical protein
MKSSTTAFISVKYAHGEFQNNEHNSIHETILNWYHVEGHAFWSYTVTEDGTLICHYKARSKHQNMK